MKIRVTNAAVARELKHIAIAEEKLALNAESYSPLPLRAAIEEKIPAKVEDELKKAFCKAFEVVFDKGTGLIEKTISAEELEKDFQVRDYALDLRRSHRGLAMMEADAMFSSLVGTLVSAAEGVGLGALGIGLPDVVLFVAMVLRAAYETALRYGFAYDTDAERLFILTLLEGAMVKGEAWTGCNGRIDAMLIRRKLPQPTAEQLSAQLRRTSDAFALDMLAAKFIQGLPIVGIAGGLTNPVYYNRITRFVRMKYKKRYLLNKLNATR